MTTALDPHPYECKFYYPFDAASYDAATAKVTVKAPERGDSRTKGRNQSFARTHNGQVVVYDMGNNLSDMLRLTFDQMPQSEYAALIVFLDYVGWGGNKIKYVDYKGDEYIVRVYRNTVQAVNRGEIKFSDLATTLYDFELELIDITNNPVDNGQTAVPSQLAVHLADFNHPHNPKVTANVAAADGTKTIESVLVDDFKHVTWIIVLHKSTTYSRTILIHASHNGSSAADATSVDFQGPEVISEVGTVPTDITVTVDINGAGTAQIMRLRIAKAANDVDVALRRIKL